jgi:hypothetical protein
MINVQSQALVLDQQQCHISTAALSMGWKPQALNITWYFMMPDCRRPIQAKGFLAVLQFKTAISHFPLHPARISAKLPYMIWTNTNISILASLFKARSYLWFRQCGDLRGSVSRKSTARSRQPERAMTTGNTTKARQHSISQALPIEESSLKKLLWYFRPDGKKLVTTKGGQRLAKIETVPLPDF